MQRVCIEIGGRSGERNLVVSRSFRGVDENDNWKNTVISAVVCPGRGDVRWLRN